MRSSKAPPVALSGFEVAVLVQLGAFLVGTTWAFGGNADFVKPYLCLWGSLGVLLTIAASLPGKRREQVNLRALRWLWPFGLFNVLVLLSALTPALREMRIAGSSYYVQQTLPWWKPAAARPVLALRALWLFDGIYLSCFNLALAVRHRRALRGLLLVAAGNALVLAVFGTIQKLLHAKGLFFGMVKSPQEYFFSSFIYHNHWGSFMVLMSAACLGLVRYYGGRGGARDYFHTPAFTGLVAVLFLAATVPLSTSRSCTVLMAVLLGGAFLHWLSGLGRRRREFGESVALPLAGAALAILIEAGTVWFLARDVIAVRVAHTREQITVLRERGDTGVRGMVYRDTARMGMDRPWLGWGMDSYPYVFWAYDTQQANPIDKVPIFYHDAHSDWLQSFAEHGLVGTALLGLCALVPVASLRRRGRPGPLTAYPLAGCALILLYAWVEFPFGNVAVVLSWWLCFFCAVRHARLSPGR